MESLITYLKSKDESLVSIVAELFVTFAQTEAVAALLVASPSKSKIIAKLSMVLEQEASRSSDLRETIVRALAAFSLQPKFREDFVPAGVVTQVIIL